MDKPPFQKLAGPSAFDGYLRTFFLEYLGYAGIKNDPYDADSHWRFVIAAESARPFAISYSPSLSALDRRRGSRLYIEHVVPHRDRAGSDGPVLYGFTDGARLVFFSADPARNRDDRFDLSEATWKFRGVQEKVALLHIDQLRLPQRLGRKLPQVEFLFEARALSADEGFKRYVERVREELMRSVLEERQALAAVVYYLLESPDARDSSKTVFVGKGLRLKKTIEELHLEVGVQLGDAVAAAVDTLLLRYVMIRFLEAYHPESMEGLLKSEDMLKQGKGGRKVRTAGSKAQMALFGGGGVTISSFSDTELELARAFSDALGIDVSKAKVKPKGADQRQVDLFAFDDEKQVATLILAEEAKREARLGGDFYLADLGQAARAVETRLLEEPTSRGAKIIWDFLGRTGASEAQWDFRYEDLRPQTLQDYYESSLNTAVELKYDEQRTTFSLSVTQSSRQRKELGAYTRTTDSVGTWSSER
jgi:hypothetical protein